MNSSLNDEFIMKRSRTSSISSVSGAPVPSGVPGSVRNPIRSSYSSSHGYAQVFHLIAFSLGGIKIYSVADWGNAIKGLRLKLVLEHVDDYCSTFFVLLCFVFIDPSNCAFSEKSSIQSQSFSFHKPRRISVSDSRASCQESKVGIFKCSQPFIGVWNTFE